MHRVSRWNDVGTGLVVGTLLDQFVPLDCRAIFSRRGAVVGVDWRCDLAEVRKFLGPKRAVQGNLDPIVLFSSQAEIKHCVKQVLEAGKGPGHIFNLGHGVLPEMPEDNVKALVHIVRELSSV